ncbi:aluminum-activated malate transporter 8 [Quercus suber]|uniref:Aluminum-activated malate transporter 8 n=1 Tax=Quercus suber TaxID=58331 RepID=A0AAW0LHK9_QUESU
MGYTCSHWKIYKLGWAGVLGTCGSIVVSYHSTLQTYLLVNAKSATQEKAGPLALAWDWVKALPLNFKNIAVNLVRPTKKLGQDDPRRVMHSLKVGLTLTLLSLLYYWRPLYNGFGVSGVWAVLTVVLPSAKVFRHIHVTSTLCHKAIQKGILAYLVWSPPIQLENTSDYRSRGDIQNPRNRSINKRS